MIRNTWLSYLLGILAGCSLSLSALAAEGITGVNASPSPAKLNAAGVAEVKIVIDGDPTQSWCGLRIEYGDGDGTDVKIDNDNGRFPRTITHHYTSPGTYTIKVTGKKVTTRFPCSGGATTTLNVEKSDTMKKSTVPAAMPEPICPGGWKVSPGSVKKDGSFSCMPMMPEQKIQCGNGLVYFEKGSTLGCKKGRK